MGRFAVEQLPYRFPSFWSHPCDVDRRLYTVMVERGDHSAGVRVSCQHDRAASSFHYPAQRGQVIGE